MNDFGNAESAREYCIVASLLSLVFQNAFGLSKFPDTTVDESQYRTAKIREELDENVPTVTATGLV